MKSVVSGVILPDMFNLEILAVAIALGCDAFSVAIGVGTLGLTKRRIFRLSFHFGLFQFFMPLIGLLIGEITASLVGQASHWVAAGLLALI
ncbi:manganese efflux pump MntP family protein, partial [bacterium]|nr:manganese efflux pump MntP family protein [bacterium]